MPPHCQSDHTLSVLLANVSPLIFRPQPGHNCYDTLLKLSTPFGTSPHPPPGGASAPKVSLLPAAMTPRITHTTMISLFPLIYVYLCDLLSKLSPVSFLSSK